VKAKDWMAAMSSEKTRIAARKCPICKQTAHSDFRPFCSRGCRDRDLMQWFGEGYALPGAQPAELDDGSQENDDA